MCLRTLFLFLVLACTTLIGCDKPSNTVSKEANNDASPVQPLSKGDAATEVGATTGADVLTRLGITLQVEHQFLTNAQVRAAFDRAYQVLGAADPGITKSGWTVIVADNTDMTSAFTEMHTDFKNGRTQIAAPLYRYAGAHEAVHFLMGEVTWNNWLPGYMMEFIAAQAEDEQPPGARQDSYEILNRGILRLPFSTATKNVSGSEGAIGAGSNGSYDGMRYALLRSIADKIGKDNAQKLAAEVYRLAAHNRRFTGVEELKPLFAKYGVGECVLFAAGDKPGKYGDFFFNSFGTPIIIYKQIDDQGGESSFQSNLDIAYQKNGLTAYSLQAQTNPTGVTTDDGGTATAHWADGVKITMNGKTIAYTFTNNNGTFTASRVKQK